ncbi:unnamed protein product [Discosporangium mesarthrocarpum]
MVFVCCFSSTLDVAAIEMDMGESLDTNGELQMVGWSNFVSGLSGGFVGSYIFSQTMFTRRTGCTSRMVGGFVALVELGVCLARADPLSYTPLAFFGSALVFIAVDLGVEWLWEVRERLPCGEYTILLVTFVAIQVVGLNPGLLVGGLWSVLSFVMSYASERRNTLRRVYKRARIMRPTKHRRILQVGRPWGWRY